MLLVMKVVIVSVILLAVDNGLKTSGQGRGMSELDIRVTKEIFQLLGYAWRNCTNRLTSY